MSMFSNIQSPGNGPQDKKPTKPSGQQEPQTSVKDFVSGLNLFGDKQLTATQKAQVDKEASIFFNQFDKDGTQGLSSTEQTAAKSAVPEFIQQISVSDVFATDKTNGAKKTDSITADATSEASNKQDLDDLKSLGYNITEDPASGTFYIEKDGKVGTITIDNTGNVKFSGVAQKAMAELSTKKSAEKLNATLDKYEQQGFVPVGNPVKQDDMLVGTLQNDKGEQVKIDLYTGNEIK